MHKYSIILLGLNCFSLWTMQRSEQLESFRKQRNQQNVVEKVSYQLSLFRAMRNKATKESLIEEKGVRLATFRHYRNRLTDSKIDEYDNDQEWFEFQDIIDQAVWGKKLKPDDLSPTIKLLKPYKKIKICEEHNQIIEIDSNNHYFPRESFKQNFNEIQDNPAYWQEIIALVKESESFKQLEWKDARQMWLHIVKKVEQAWQDKMRF